MSNELTATELRSRIVDFSSTAEALEGLRKAGARIRHGEALTRVDAFVIGACADVILATTPGQTAQDLAVLAGMSSAYVSKSRTVANILGAVPTYEGDDSKVLEQIGNVRTYWQYATNGTDIGFTLDYLCDKYVGADGTERVGAIGNLIDQFGSVETIYMVAKGKRFHADDPRHPDNVQTEETEETEETETDESESVWQDMVARAVQVAKSHGASVTEVMAIVNAQF